MTDQTTPPTAADLEWLSLDDGEEIIWAGGPDRRTLVPTVLVGLPLAIVLIGIVIIVSEYLRVTNIEYVVTNRGLYRKSGVLSRDVKRIEHEKVQDISYSQSALGNHFGYGTVEVSTAGGAGVELSFKSVPDPSGVQHLISEQLKRDRGPGGDGDGRPTDEVLADILAELRAIRQSLEERPQQRRSEAGSDGTAFEWTGGDGNADDEPRSPRS
ncbi:PH domain-containing protein [Halopiger djelfimassiliensis]|uniref:PH domain-containing protein n=1 Tax=Halopiger djelfimassiliensis TaxID=1293047 RepID=UPI0009DB73C8|nr:PH domain-containing protein [Halopiger djelfimassiliensis]